MAARVYTGYRINAQEPTANSFIRSQKMSIVSLAETVEMARVVSTNIMINQVRINQINQVRINLLF